SNNIDDWYDDDIYDAVTSSGNPYLKFIDNIDKIKKLAKDKTEQQQKTTCLVCSTRMLLQLWKRFMLSYSLIL
ncbi:hypothetical protein, partial [Mycobacterium avium]|uniref:hypothetical protein n=1 Tax=Mycobacterium avium TaxID=1764 RepID=UPI001E2E455B